MEQSILTGKIRGKAIVSNLCSKSIEGTCIGIDACLRPWRRVSISQWFGKELLGGVTIQVQVPLKGPCALKLPSTETEVSLKR